MLELEDLRAGHGDFRLAAEWHLPAGRIAAVIGPSGGGKSTLLDAIAGFLAPEAGRVLWHGRDLGPLAPGERPVAMLFQDNNLFPHLTAAENVALALTPKRRLTAAQRAEVEAALARVGLEGFGARRPAELSGGQQGRVALARVLLQRKPLLLLDEPFSALGPAQRGEMLDLVAELARETGATVLMVSHAPEDARRIADAVVLVAEGRAQAPEPTERLFADPPPALRAYLG
ncbi:ATP-binding cassette domain-containing protein [Rhodosalinus sediminis]|uniref:ATP-binding cassette domain-containing protein n=1 Tax=Rhodosalinus sediminis TaxID=1940533 RepID=A0A3D9BWB1_9RHOB|nr:ATP-binding cassette domain-containing protein [Rhodosalinus sediminis]REC57732.1 ATP-binding cassette domain-containing protein [Rhodosalinus sediminis]